MNDNLKQLVWVEKYRPNTIDECILPDHIKETFRGFVEKGNIPNLLLNGPPGLGKTSIAKAVLKELAATFMVINGSLSGNIDTVRNEMQSFASTSSLFGKGRKYILIDEADYMNPNSTQPALRSFSEEFSSNCGFILTTNYKNRLIEPLQSRFVGVDFNFSAQEIKKLKVDFFKRLCYILDNEGIEHDKNVLVQLIQKHFPDMRRIINEIERYSANGKIDTGILVSVLDSNFDSLIKFLKTKNFTEMRKWVGENSHIESNTLVRKLYDKLDGVIVQSSIPEAIMILDEYQHKAAFVNDMEINNVAMLTRCMADLQFL